MTGAFPTRKMAVLVNAEAGTCAGLSKEKLLEQLVSAFAPSGIETDIQLLAPGKLVERAREALGRVTRGEIQAIVAGGGDGSIRSIAEVLAGKNVPLGILPLGTRNHFAKDLGLPQDLPGAAAIIAGGAIRPVDVAEVNGKLFVNNSSIGIYPYMVLDRERRRRETGLQKWLAMLLAGLRTLTHLPLRRLRIDAGGQHERCRTPCLFVGNNAYALELLPFTKRERMDGGQLWLCIAKQKTRFAVVWLAIRSVFGLLNPARDLDTLLSTEAQVASHTSRLVVAIDGEVEIMRPPLHYRIRPKELLVYAPSFEP